MVQPLEPQGPNLLTWKTPGASQGLLELQVGTEGLLSSG